MTVRTIAKENRFTPDADGTLTLNTLSLYLFESHSEAKEIRVFDLKTGQSTVFSDDSRNKVPTWLVGNSVIWAKNVEGGSTELWIARAGDAEKAAYLAGIVPAPISNLKVRQLKDGVIAIAILALAAFDGSVYNPQKVS
ncbi:hypothetical protein MMC24_001417 [Lignoscripta atroalba]|nr:hypothetical protein [Lignoscripta atroalba]